MKCTKTLDNIFSCLYIVRDSWIRQESMERDRIDVFLNIFRFVLHGDMAE